MELMNARGTRDFAPEEKIVRQNVIDLLRDTFELYGFSPLETPILERFDVISAKYAGGAEILKETFRLNDQGERDLCLRYDLTVPLARFVGMNKSLKMPFKRYAIGEVFRDGPIKAGRCREFWQCDVDVVGSKSMLADAQCIQIAQRFFEKIGIDFVIEVNNRKIIDGFLEYCGVPEEKRTEAIVEIDKLKKTDINSVKKEMKNKGIKEESAEKICQILEISGSNSEKIKKLKSKLSNKTALEGIEEMEELLRYVDQKNVVFNIALARGLSYYTGPVFEVFLKDQKIFGSSLAGGGRWDRMIGEFLGSEKEYPAVGISFGIEPITTVMKLLDKSKEATRTVTTAYIIPIKTTEKCLDIAEEMRAAGIKTDMDLAVRGISKNLEYANSLGIPYTLIVGEDEIKQNKIKLRSMESGKEEMLSLKEICRRLKNNE